MRALRYEALKKDKNREEQTDFLASRQLRSGVRGGRRRGGNSMPLPALEITLLLWLRAGAGSGRSTGWALARHGQPGRTPGSLARDSDCSAPSAVSCLEPEPQAGKLKSPLRKAPSAPLLGGGVFSRKPSSAVLQVGCFWKVNALEDEREYPETLHILLSLGLETHLGGAGCLLRK